MRAHLASARGRWLTRDRLLWAGNSLPPGLDPQALEWSLHLAPDGGIDPWQRTPAEWASVPLTVIPVGQRGDLPTWASGDVALRVPALSNIEEALTGQVGVIVRSASGRLINASGVQLAGVLDDVYGDRAARAVLGASFRDGVPTVRVWAPTARRVGVLLWQEGSSLDGEPDEVPLVREPDGCWSRELDPQWVNASYQYAVTVFVPDLGAVVTNRTTDPYSVALTENSTASVLVDLDDPRLAPEQWLTTSSPRLAKPVQQVIYELHVREFSRADDSVPAELRGTYGAFSVDSAGTRHLRALSAAGLNTVQLLPIYDFVTVEDAPDRRPAQDTAVLASFAPDSTEQQRHVRQLAPRTFNWGYDPWHVLAPEGSYASRDGIHGGARVAEVRGMVGALHAAGLRVVLDQVFNHTFGAGQDHGSVLARIVPGYYHRRDDVGAVYTSTCCPNVATEHVMAEKLMVDACVHWVRRYRVDGFRFDLMGHHSVPNLLAVRAALDGLTVERDGVDGSAVTLHGEGWNFGEVADNARFVQATQGQLGGTHIATFNDRLRDAVRGGAPFAEDLRLQGFGTGLFTAPNASLTNGTPQEQCRRLLHDADLIQLGLLGNLRSARFRSQLSGTVTRGSELRYHDVAAGYADAPDEVVNYVDAHDNETLFDALTLKLPLATSMADRVRANTVCLALATLGQAPVLWHAGADFLRSKSLDRNSYDSGDWFNYLDFSLTDNGFGAGLPPEPDNGHAWPLLRPLLAQRALKPTPEDMRRAHEAAVSLLKIRTSSPLFTLGEADAVAQKVSFPASGTWRQIPGVIWMLLDDTVGDPVDPQFARVSVVFNGTPWPIRQRREGPGDAAWELHPVQASGPDLVTRSAAAESDSFAVPGRTVAVFVQPR